MFWIRLCYIYSRKHQSDFIWEAFLLLYILSYFFLYSTRFCFSLSFLLNCSGDEVEFWVLRTQVTPLGTSSWPWVPNLTFSVCPCRFHNRKLLMWNLLNRKLVPWKFHNSKLLNVHDRKLTSCKLHDSILLSWKLLNSKLPSWKLYNSQLVSCKLHERILLFLKFDNTKLVS